MSYLLVIILISFVLQLDGKALWDGNFIDLEEHDAASEQKGLTFVKQAHLAQFGIDLIGCRNWPDANGMNCDAYRGDTLCSEFRPVLCVNIDNTPRPAYAVTGSGTVMPNYRSVGWNKGHVTTTVPVQGSQFIDRVAVDAFCATSFGVGWRVAEFHDGYYIPGMNGDTYADDSWTKNSRLQKQGGWSFYSYGDVRRDIRFWVHINDKPSTCWSQ